MSPNRRTIKGLLARVWLKANDPELEIDGRTYMLPDGDGWGVRAQI
jgi:hypothetical protein